MSHTIYAGNVAKRKNSTLQPTLTASYDVLLKSPTSLHTPTFTISAASFPYNYLKWDDRYYFVTDVVARNNGLWEVSAVVDVLATYKSDILASTQFVSYSSVSGGTWLVDSRMPVMKNVTVSKNTTATGILSHIGCYILSAVGKDACVTYMVNSAGTLNSMMQQIDSWSAQDVSDLLNGTDFSTVESALSAITTVISRTSLMGNAYETAPACIRSCIWVPFDNALAPASGSGNIWLGRYNTSITATKIAGTPVTGSASVSIPWHHSDWRRSYCEQVYLYLPFVGLVNLSSDALAQSTTITVKWSVTYTDGTIAYEVISGNQIIGTYGGQCSANYPLGLSQQASAGQIVQSAFNTADKIVSGAINSSLSPVSMGGAAAQGILSGIEGGYDIANLYMTYNPSCVGGIGGGAGSGLDLTIACYTVAHDTVITPAQMQTTLGVPTMKPLTLSSCSGYCQCANAHVAAAAELQELNEIDAYLNNGFYIE